MVDLRSTPRTAAQRALGAVSLDALRGFEAAARRNSVTAAAEELCLTQSAVSKQIKLLEETVGRPLLVRGSRGLALTADGRELFQAARLVLAELEQSFERILGAARRSVAITVPPSFATLWLAPRLAALHAELPDLNVSVDTSEKYAVLEREGFDLAVRLVRPGLGDPGWKRLAQERVMLVAAPALAARVALPDDLRLLPRLVFQHPLERFGWMSWAHWYEQLALPQAAEQPVFQFSQYEHVIKAAIEGVGVAIGRTPLVLPALRAGQLQVVAPQIQADGFEYHQVIATTSAGRPEVEALAAWIERELLADTLG